MIPGAASLLAQSGGKAASSALSLGTGLLQGIQANKLKKKADAAMPQLVDPNQASYLAELNQKRKSIETGADFAEGMQAADTSQASTNDAIIKASGGDSGGTLQGLLNAQRVAGDTKNKVLSEGQNQQFGYDSAYGNQLNLIAARKLQLEMQKSQQLRAEWAKKAQTGSQNRMAGIGGLTQMASGPAGAASGGGGIESLIGIFGKTPASPAAPAAASPLVGMEQTGVQAPTVVPQDNLATKGLGTVIDLIK